MNDVKVVNVGLDEFTRRIQTILLPRMSSMIEEKLIPDLTAIIDEKIRATFKLGATFGDINQVRLNRKGAAYLLGVTPQTVKNRIDAGHLNEHIYEDGESRYVLLSEVLKLKSETV